MLIFWLLIVAIYMGCAFSGLIGFDIWSQVEDLWNQGVPLWDMYSHPHGLRFALILPVFMASDYLNLDPEWLFSVLISSIIVFISISVESTIAILTDIEKKKRGKVIVFVTIFYMFLSLFMNGRIVFSMLGGALLLKVIISLQQGNVGFWTTSVKILFALLLTSVSSGTFIVANLFFYGCLFYFVFRQILKMKLSKKNLGITIVFGGLLFLALPLFLILINKNLDFFGGGLDGFIHMMDHGIGMFFKGDFIIQIIIAAFFFLFIFSSLLFFAILSKKVRIPIFFIAAGSFGALFGISTTFVALPSLIVFLVLILNDFKLRPLAESIE